MRGCACAERVVKNQLRELLEHRRLEEIATLATRKKRTLGSLVSLTFDPDPLIVWRAVEAMGVAAGWNLVSFDITPISGTLLSWNVRRDRAAPAASAATLTPMKP